MNAENPILVRDRGLRIVAGLKLGTAFTMLTAAAVLFWPACREAALTVAGPEILQSAREMGIDARDAAQRIGIERKTTFLVVSSQPSGASVLVDGNDRGITPLATQLNCDNRITPWSIEVRKRGFDTWTEEVTCDPGSTRKLSVRLRRWR